MDIVSLNRTRRNGEKTGSRYYKDRMDGTRDKLNVEEAVDDKIQASDTRNSMVVPSHPRPQGTVKEKTYSVLFNTQ